MSTLELNQNVPDFTAKATSNKDLLLSACKGYFVILYFYPKDNTPGCSAESQEFSELYQQFVALNTCTFGISKDSLKSHEKFKSKYDLPFELISDEDGTLCTLFDVMKLKNMYGKQFIGIERSTFLIDPQGKLVRKWHKVKAKGHAAEVLQTVKDLHAIKKDF